MSKFSVILVGGSGTRLWPMSRKHYPKQFVEFRDGKSLFQLTVLRTLKLSSPGSIAIVSGEPYRFIIVNQIDMLPELTAAQKKSLKKNLVFEPEPKNTLPAIILGMKFLEKRGFSNSSTLYVFPSDHIIQPLDKFMTSLQHGAIAAEDGKLAVFGIVPDSPNTGYGYVVPEQKPDARTNSPYLKVERFTEKPDETRAQQLIDKCAMWNAGIFCFKKSAFLSELSTHCPEFRDYYTNNLDDMIASFASVSANSIDYALMQKTTCAAVVPFLPEWSDLGSWDSLLSFFARAEENYTYGQSVLMESRNCLTYSPDRLIAGIGLENLMIVDSPDSVLVIRKGESDKVKQLVDRLEKKRPEQVENSPTVYRPWGYYTVLFENQGYKVKELGVYPGRSLSLQKHRHRSEHWNIVEGKARIVIGEDICVRSKNQSVFVPKGTRHKLSNPCKKMLRIIEVQIGDYLGEDDIIRFDTHQG